MRKIFILSIILTFISCEGFIRTNDPVESYKYWAGDEPPKEINLINGEYLQTPHFTLEYQLFLQFKSNGDWFNEFIKYNNLKIDTINNDWKSGLELPKWFNPSKDFIKYSRNQHDEFDRSRYFVNPKNGMCYIFETFGM